MKILGEIFKVFLFLVLMAGILWFAINCQKAIIKKTIKEYEQEKIKK